MLLSDIIDKFLDKHRLADSRSTEQSDLSSLEIRLQKVYNLDSGEEHLLRSRKVFELRRLTMNRKSAIIIQRGDSVNGFAHNIHDASPDLRAHGHRYRRIRAGHLKSAAESVGTVHRNSADSVLADMLLHLKDNFLAVCTGNFQRFINGRELVFACASQIKMHIDYGADNLRNLSFKSCHRKIIRLPKTMGNLQR